MVIKINDSDEFLIRLRRELLKLSKPSPHGKTHDAYLDVVEVSTIMETIIKVINNE